jgi:hypothetical protein
MTHDRHFSALLRDPSRILATCPAACCEVNVSIFDHSPKYEALAAIGRKRACARQWQENGIPILVDLFVPQRFRDICLLGVPPGWKAFSTRGVAGRTSDLIAEYELAKEHAGQEPTLLVIGGGLTIRSLSSELPGAIFVEDFQAQRRLYGASNPCIHDERGAHG